MGWRLLIDACMGNGSDSYNELTIAERGVEQAPRILPGRQVRGETTTTVRIQFDDDGARRRLNEVRTSRGHQRAQAGISRSQQCGGRHHQHHSQWSRRPEHHTTQVAQCREKQGMGNADTDDFAEIREADSHRRKPLGAKHRWQPGGASWNMTILRLWACRG